MFDECLRSVSRNAFLQYQKRVVGLPSETIIPSSLALDVVIPTAGKDIVILPLAIEGVQRNLRHPVREVFVLAPKEDLAAVCKAVEGFNVSVLDEREVLPCARERISYVPCGVDRTGWLVQQLIKLNGGCIVGEKDYFVIDSDTVLVRKQKFEENNKYTVLAAEEFHRPYYDVFRNVFGYHTPSMLSCVAHMMIFNVKFLREMLSEIEAKHNMEWCDAVMMMCDAKSTSGFSEYEMFGHWMCFRHKESVVRSYFFNTPLRRDKAMPVALLEREFGTSFRSVSFQDYYV